MRSIPDPGQRARITEVLVQELAALREHALAGQADPAKIDEQLRRRVARMPCPPATCAVHPDPSPEQDDLGVPVWPDETGYSTWW